MLLAGRMIAHAFANSSGVLESSYSIVGKRDPKEKEKEFKTIRKTKRNKKKKKHKRFL
jgi:hypothetical protein